MSDNKKTDVVAKEQILAATGEELSRLAGEVLQPDVRSGKHDNRGNSRGYLGRVVDWKCVKCGEVTDGRGPTTHCNGFDSIHLTWPEAMKWRDWAVKEFGTARVSTVVQEVFGGKDAPAKYLLLALPEHYIKAACLCKIEK
jgi:hypothetical protein